MEDLIYRDQSQHVRHSDREQKQGGHSRSDDAAHAFENIEATLQGGRGNREGDRERDNNRGMSKREEQSDPDRTPAFLHQLARHVVDGRDMIGVKGVA